MCRRCCTRQLRIARTMSPHQILMLMPPQWRTSEWQTLTPWSIVDWVQPAIGCHCHCRRHPLYLFNWSRPVHQWLVIGIHHLTWYRKKKRKNITKNTSTNDRRYHQLYLLGLRRRRRSWGFVGTDSLTVFGGGVLTAHDFCRKPIALCAHTFSTPCPLAHTSARIRLRNRHCLCCSCYP